MNTVTCGSHSQESSDKVSWQIWRDIIVFRSWILRAEIWQKIILNAT